MKRLYLRGLLSFCMWLVTLCLVSAAPPRAAMYVSGHSVMPSAIARMPDACQGQSEGDPFCVRVVAAEIRAQYHITNPNGVTGFEPVKLANFEQRVLSSAPGALDIEIISTTEVDTTAPYPVDHEALPTEIRPYLGTVEWGIQWDDPEIQALAQSLVVDASRQVEAVELILAWIRANIVYDHSYSLPNDAVSVLHNRSGVCSGFSRLSTALLRAAGVPAQYIVGCATDEGFVTGPEGGTHAWVAVYYPDVGWIHSEPQVSINYLEGAQIIGSKQTSYIPGFDQCGQTDTLIETVLYEDSREDIHEGLALLTPYKQVSGGYEAVGTAAVPDWDRWSESFQVTPVEVKLVASQEKPLVSTLLRVFDGRCRSVTRTVSSDAAWLTSSTAELVGSGTILLQIDTSELPIGIYHSTVSVDGWTGQRTASVELHVVGQTYESYLPYVFRERIK